MYRKIIMYFVYTTIGFLIGIFLGYVIGITKGGIQ